MGERTVKLIRNIEKNANAIMIMYDICSSKKDYKEFYKFVKKQVKDAKRFDRENTRMHLVRYIRITDAITVTSIIRNCNPNSLNDALREVGPIELYIEFSNQENGHNLHTNGSGMFGGCNMDEAKELLCMIKEGMADFTKEEI